MNAGNQRECPFCAETILTEAKVCPHCHQWLTLCSFRNPVVTTCVMTALLLALFAILWAGVVSYYGRLINSPPYYTEFLGTLRVTESRMGWGEQCDKTYIYITGVLTNQSQIAWKSVEFDCRFYDRNGKLVDASNGHGYFTINPNDDSAFRVSVTPAAPTNDYASFKISVSNARNGKSWF